METRQVDPDGVPILTYKPAGKRKASVAPDHTRCSSVAHHSTSGTRASRNGGTIESRSAQDTSVT